MTYKMPLTTTATGGFGVMKIGTGLSVTNGVVSTSGGSSTIGTWVPTITVATAGTITLLSTTANFSKIGQQVTCYFDVNVATRVGGANTSVLTMGGLPFVSIVGAGTVGSLVVTIFENLNNNWSYITGTIAGNSTSVELYTIHNTASNIRLTYADVQVTPLPTRLVGTISYLSAS